MIIWTFADHYPGQRDPAFGFRALLALGFLATALLSCSKVAVLRTNPTLLDPSDLSSSVEPAVSIDSPAEASYINTGNASAFVISGSCSMDGQTVTLSGDAVGTVPCSNLVWSATLDFSAVAYGPVSITATQSTASATIHFTKDADPSATGETILVAKNSGAATVSVLDNDTDPENDSLSVSAVDTTGTSGTVTNGSSSVSYTPANNFTGIDTFSYTVSDGHGGTASATVTVKVMDPFTWIGANATHPHDWTQSGNWCGSVVAGACAGGAAPNSSQIAIFDGTCSGTACNATVNASISIGGIRLNSGYPGTITQGTGNTISVSTSGWTQSAGTFTGSDSNITINGSFSLSAGSFTSTSATLRVNASWTISGTPTFTHNSGTLTFGTGNKTITPGTVDYHHVTFIGGGYDNNTVSGTMTILGDLTTTNTDNRSSLSSGTLAVSGNVSFSNNGYYGSTVIQLVGSSDQTVSAPAGTPCFPGFEIASTGGTVTFSGTFSVSGNFIHTSGTVDLSGASISFGSATTTQTVDASTLVFQDVTVLTGSYLTFAVTGTLHVAGNLTLACSDSRSSFSGGTIEVSGDLTTSSSCNKGTTVISLVGSTDQGIYSTDGTYSIPNLNIASTGGTVSFFGSFTNRGNFTYTSGVVDTGTSTVTFTWSNQAANLATAGLRFYNVTLSPIDYATTTLADPMVVDGDLTLAAIDARSSVNGTFTVSGNLISTSGLNVGNAAIELVGSSASTVTVAAGANLYTGNVTIQKTGGAGVSLASDVSWNGSAQSVSVVSGNVDMAGHNLTAKSLALNGNTITENGGTLTVAGSTAAPGSLFGGTVSP